MPQKRRISRKKRVVKGIKLGVETDSKEFFIGNQKDNNSMQVCRAVTRKDPGLRTGEMEWLVTISLMTFLSQVLLRNGFLEMPES